MSHSIVEERNQGRLNGIRWQTVFAESPEDNRGINDSAITTWYAFASLWRLITYIYPLLRDEYEIGENNLLLRKMRKRKGG
jgi:hypothetical protein